jgi:hypothetical protein
LPVASGGTGASSNSTAPFALKGANSDITSLSGLTTALSVAQGGTGAATLTANNVLLGNGTSALQAVAPGSSGNVLTSNGTTWASSAAPAPADGSITDAKIADAVSGTSYQSMCTAQTIAYSTNSTSYVRGCSARIYRTGTYNFKVRWQVYAATSYLRIYKNGVALSSEITLTVAAGITTTTFSSLAFTEGDLFSIYIRGSTTGAEQYVFNAQFSSATNTAIAPIGTISIYEAGPNSDPGIPLTN